MQENTISSFPDWDLEAVCEQTRSWRAFSERRVRGSTAQVVVSSVSQQSAQQITYTGMVHFLESSGNARPCRGAGRRKPNKGGHENAPFRSDAFLPLTLHFFAFRLVSNSTRWFRTSVVSHAGRYWRRRPALRGWPAATTTRCRTASRASATSTRASPSTPTEQARTTVRCSPVQSIAPCPSTPAGVRIAGRSCRQRIKHSIIRLLITSAWCRASATGQLRRTVKLPSSAWESPLRRSTSATSSSRPSLRMTLASIPRSPSATEPSPASSRGPPFIQLCRSEGELLDHCAAGSQADSFFRSFAIRPIANKLYLRPNSSRVFPLEFRPRQTLGHFSDFLTFSFAVGTGTSRRTFAIQRTVSAKVAVQADVDALGPKTPYIAVPKSAARPRAVDHRIVRGPKLQTGPPMQWVRKLDLYKAPSIVRDALHGQDVKEQVSR